jgi:DNA-binding LacI/PurR family transcriptional regulator
MYNDFAWTRLTTPPLTVIAQPVYNMGLMAAKAPYSTDWKTENPPSRHRP